MRDFITERLKASWKNAKKVHRYWLKTNDGWIRLLISLIIYVPLSWQLLLDDWKLGASFILAGFMAIYSGVIYKGENVMALVIVGVILGTVVPQLLFDAWKTIKYGDWIGAVIILALAIYIWYWSSTMKKGELPKLSDSKRRRRGKRVIIYRSK